MEKCTIMLYFVVYFCVFVPSQGHQKVPLLNVEDKLVPIILSMHLKNTTFHLHILRYNTIFFCVLHGCIVRYIPDLLGLHY